MYEFPENYGTIASTPGQPAASTPSATPVPVELRVSSSIPPKSRVKMSYYIHGIKRIHALNLYG